MGNKQHKKIESELNFNLRSRAQYILVNIKHINDKDMYKNIFYRSDIIKMAEYGTQKNCSTVLLKPLQPGKN